MKRFKVFTLSTLAAAAVSLAQVAQSTDVEVLHWWTTAGQAKAVAELKIALENQGYGWKDFAVTGGGGQNAMTVLKSRVVAGDPPTAAMMKAPLIYEWAEEGLVTDIHQVAIDEKWDELLPPMVQEIMTRDGKYIGAPVNIHRINWMRVNPKVMQDAGVEVPETWDEFFEVAEVLQANGVIPLAHGGQNWQELTLFEPVMLGVGGADFYRKVFVDFDVDAINSETMVEVLDTFKRLKAYTDKNAPGRTWNLTTAMVMRGEAAMQIMGDWVKGEFSAAGMTAPEEYLCVPAPGTGDGFVFTVDSFGMFKQKDEAELEGQQALAAAIMSHDFQRLFNLAKGSIPVRLDVDMNEFDSCAQGSSADLASSGENGTIVPSLAHRSAAGPTARGAMIDLISQFWNDDNLSSADAQAKLADAAARLSS
ncbi:MAG: ABC transporter substrate-binding protein [Rhodobacteraceae bacterium]|nr:ABC transporter substrate-binding protein [Paracoccaceae bacterium]MCY4140660.1 ABC transporter substrate-binding protein [Paracoccaceae bacterium]